MDVRESVFVAAAILGVGCGDRPVTPADAGNETEGDGSCELYPGCSECSPIGLPIRNLDILLVIDGSVGSAGAQTRLAAALDQLITELDASEHPIDWRIAVTTTDMGPPACDPIATTPERGQFVASSCRERLGDFVDQDGQDFTAACTDTCGLAQLERLPTLVVGEAEPAPRAWIERDTGQSNLPADVDLREAARCLAMVGVSGCRFESPLAAIEAAVLASEDPGSPNFGFFRSDSRKAIVVVSDAADCSWTEVGLPIFDPAGARAFWSDPLADAPTPAVCWNAGTNCSTVDDVLACEPGYYKENGDPTGWPDKIVLERTTHFSDLLLWDLYLDPDLLFFSGLTADGQVHYDYAEDPAFALEHGIGPGCDDQAGTIALPPVRTREFLREMTHYYNDEAYLAEHSASICAPDFSPPLLALGQRLLEQVDRASCYPRRPCDVDPSTELLEVECELEAYAQEYGAEPFFVDECARGEDGAYLLDPDTGRAQIPNPDAELCWLARTDATGLTADPLDDVWPDCQTEFEDALGIEIVTRDGRSPNLWIYPRCTE